MTCFYERILHHTTYIPTPPTKDVFLSLRFSFVAQGAGVLRISIDGNDRMGAKIKTQCKRNAYGFRQNPRKNLWAKNYPLKISQAEFPSLKKYKKAEQAWLYFIRRTTRPECAGITTNLQIVLNNPKKSVLKSSHLKK